MSKPRSDSTLDNLPPNQRETLERWLFEENLGYEAAAKRLHADFNIKSSTTGVWGFYQRRAQARLLDRITRNKAKANAVVERFTQEPADLYRGALNMISEIAFDKATKEELDVETIYNFTKLLIAGRKEDVRAEALTLARDRFQFDAAKACLAHLPALRSIAQDNKLDQNAKLDAIRQKLFGQLPEQSA
jgi:hypothetical protein